MSAPARPPEGRATSLGEDVAQRQEGSPPGAASTRLWYTRCPLPTASGLALDAGLLAEALADRGAALAAVETLDTPDARQSHFTHAVAGLFRQGGNIPPIWARSRGANTVLAGIAWTPEYQAILAHPGAGIRGIADLKGKRLALPVRRSGEIDFWRAMCLRGYDSALRLAGLTLADVTLVELPVDEVYIARQGEDEASRAWMWAGAARVRRQQAETFAYVRGEVDALYASGALGLQLQALLQATEVVELGFHADRRAQINNQVPNILTVDADLARNRPDIVAAYLSALNRSIAWARRHPGDALRIYAREVGAPEEWIAPSYRETDFRSLRVGLDPELIAAVSSQKDFLLEHGFIQHDFDVHEWVCGEPMRLASQET
ncbi:ABC transporter substrate-binding protein [Pigmentiphaga sp. D-2]|uniref:ABC transporter substrate-binding protein n=1 Tax=Pigmentiphaga sp. D-2 TaxID=1002116 RepID=UPI00104E4DB9|nr:ABC transporter substrate-binding protein [Pigmentiphaga sp. D-2]